MSHQLPEPSTAARIICREAEQAGVSIKYGQALNAYAKLIGYKDYTALHVHLKQGGDLVQHPPTARNSLSASGQPFLQRCPIGNSMGRLYWSARHSHCLSTQNRWLHIR